MWWMSEDESGLGGVLAAAEDAEPAASVDVVARRLHERFGARSVSFLFVDLVKRELVRLTEQGQAHGADSAERVRLEGSDYDTVLRTQELHLVPGGDGGQRVIAPVTNRGDTIGVLELTLPYAGYEHEAGMLEEIRQSAHALAYIIVADRRFTDLYQWGRRTTPVSLAAEIQHQLLPSASCCEAPQFTLAGTLLPADTVAGDTYDYTLDRAALHLSVTDAMGHDVNAALLATLAVNALRRARRAGSDPARQASQAHQAMADHAHGEFVTGLLLRISLDGRRAQIVNAGHPWPLQLRDGAVHEVQLAIDPPFGMFDSPAASYRVQELDLRPDDRLVLGSSPTTPPSCAWTGTAPGLTATATPRPHAAGARQRPGCRTGRFYPVTPGASTRTAASPGGHG
jgi:serine phosphatase RsbU (regulator of sigma subunit)